MQAVMVWKPAVQLVGTAFLRSRCCFFRCALASFGWEFRAAGVGFLEAKAASEGA